MNSTKKLLIYGASGYTGRIIADSAKELHIDFEIAGRGEKISRLAEAFGVAYHLFPVDDAAAWEKALAGKTVLINAAGPFKYTAREAMDACIRAGVHYLDISAELDTYRLAESMDVQAKAAGIQLISGAGLFVSYDALAVYLSRKVDEPQSLSIAFRHFGGFSRGSVISSKNIADLGILIRQDNQIMERQNASSKNFRFGDELIECLPTPLGGIILSHRSTGIPNIEEFFSLKLPASGMPDLDPSKLPDGPTAEERAAGRNALSGIVTGKDGTTASAWIDAPSGYTLTPLSVVAIAQRVLNGDHEAGYQSPGSAYGDSILRDIPDTRLIDL